MVRVQYSILKVAHDAMNSFVCERERGGVRVMRGAKIRKLEGCGRGGVVEGEAFILVEHEHVQVVRVVGCEAQREVVRLGPVRQRKMELHSLVCGQKST